jgi:hypothetical protein
MEQVGEGLGVHQAMLDRKIDRSRISRIGVGQPAPKGAVDEGVVEHGTDSLAIAADRREGRPVGGSVPGKTRTVERIDAKSEEPIQLGIEGLQSQAVAAEQIPIESLEMPEVEHDAVALGEVHGGPPHRPSARKVPRTARRCTTLKSTVL